MQNKLEIKNTYLTRLSDTRWGCRIRNCRAVKSNYKAIICVLSEEVEDSLNRDVSQAIGKTLFELCLKLLNIICVVYY